MESESPSREDCNPKRAVEMRDFSTTLPIGQPAVAFDETAQEARDGKGPVAMRDGGQDV